MSFIKTPDGTELYVRDMGHGRPIILIHGWPFNGDMWTFQVPTLLEAGYRVITYDRRGFGRSDHPADGYNYDQLSDDLDHIIKTLSLKNVTIVGFSMGGGEVARYVARHGLDHISQTVFVSAIPPFLLKTRDNPDGIDGDFFDDTKTNVRLDRFAFLREPIPSVYGRTESGDPVSDGILDWTFLMGAQASPVGTLACVDAWGRTDFRNDLKAMTCPCLVVHGTADETVPVNISGRRTAEMLPHARYEEYEGAGHGLVATFAERFNQDLLSFLKDAKAG